METTMNEILPDTTTPVDEAQQPNAAARPARRAGRPGNDAVTWAEFRLAMWAWGFALAVIISSQGLLYSAILDLKGEMGNFRADVQTQFGDVRVEMQELRVDVQTQVGDLRTEMQKQNGELRVEVQELRTDMQTQFGELRERIVRIETHLGVDATAADKGS